MPTRTKPANHATAAVVFTTLADVRRHLADIPAERIRLNPFPGTARMKDVVRVAAKDNCLCELIDGTLVEKTMGWHESRLALLVAKWLMTFVEQHDLGIVLGPDATLQILPRQVRLPDVCFIAWSRLPRDMANDAILAVAPDLAVEILSKSNTRREMERKLRDYFEARVRLIWYIDPRPHGAGAYTAADQLTRVSASGSLDGGDVLPGFRLSLAKLFAEAERRGPRH